MGFLQGKFNISGQTSPATIAFTSNTTAGSLLIATVRLASNANTLSIVDTQNNSWTILPKITNGVDFYFAYALNTAGGANTITATITSGAGITFTIGEYSGVNSFRTSATGATGSSLTPTSNSISATSGDLLIGFAFSSNVNWTSGTGFTLREPTGAPATGLAAFEDATAAGGSTSASFTINTSGNWGAGLAAFFQAASSGSGWVNRHRSFINKR